MLGISVGKIKKNEVKHLEGYAWKTDEKTREQFEIMKENQVPFKEGNICLDLLESENNDILETITIPEEEYLRVRG